MLRAGKNAPLADVGANFSCCGGWRVRGAAFRTGAPLTAPAGGMGGKVSLYPFLAPHAHNLRAAAPSWQAPLYCSS